VRGWIIGVCALLGAGAAQAADGPEPYAKVGAWDIGADAAKKLCSMRRFYGSVDPDKTEALLVLYSFQKQVVLLSFANNKMKYLPQEGSLNFDLAFLQGSSLDESWGSRPFQYHKLEGSYGFSHVFEGGTDIRHILHDLAGHEAITLFFGPDVMTSLPLDASSAVEKLRECALKLAENDPSEPYRNDPPNGR